MSPLNDRGAIQFIIPPTANQFIDLRRTLLHVEAKIVRSDGKDLVDAEFVAPVNLSLHSFFSQVEVELQQQLVCSNQLYGYKAYIETLLSSNEEAHSTFLRSQGFAKDNTATVDEVTDFRKNSGIFLRFVTWGKNQTADLEGPLMVDICQQDRFILNGVEINIKLWPARDTFTLMTAREMPHTNCSSVRST